MPAKVIVFGIMFVTLVALLVFMTELFLPLSAKADMDIYCRNTMLKMEIGGGLTDQDRVDLEERLSFREFSGIAIAGTDYAAQGQEINLHVEVDYNYSKLTGLFTRSNVKQHMVYNKTSIARKVVN